MEGVEPGSDHDRAPGQHPDVRHLAEDEQAEQDRPDQVGVAEGRDEADLAPAHGHDREEVAREDEEDGAGERRRPAGRDRRPITGDGRTETAHDGDGDRRQAGRQHRGHLVRQGPRRQIA
jgi:hypothetical protein